MAKEIIKFKGIELQVSKNFYGGFSVSIEHNTKTDEYFFTPFHGSKKKLSKHWVPVTYYIPQEVVKRPGLEDGIIKTVENLELVYFKNGKLIREEDAK